MVRGFTHRTEAIKANVCGVAVASASEGWVFPALTSPFNWEINMAGLSKTEARLKEIEREARSEGVFAGAWIIVAIIVVGWILFVLLPENIDSYIDRKFRENTPVLTIDCGETFTIGD